MGSRPTKAASTFAEKGSMYSRRMSILSSLILVLTTAHAVGYADPIFSLIALEGLRLGRCGAGIRRQSDSALCHQTTEFSCGPSALASLLTFYYQDPTTEWEVMRLSHTLERRTTSLTGLGEACLAKGYEATGYTMTLQQLMEQIDKSGVPVLVHFQTPTRHYALVAGQVKDYILVSDPDFGNVSMDRIDFVRRWSNRALVVSSETRPVHREILVDRQKSARVRLDTLARAGHLMSSF
jgi:predicted double-glycine peptidase